MSDVQAPETQPAMVHALRRLAPAEQRRLLEWSRGLGPIRYGALRGRQKMVALLAFTRDCQVMWPLAKLIGLTFRRVLWDARSWMMRLGLGGILATFLAVGNGGAEILNLGDGVGLPLWLWMGAGGALIGFLADRIGARLKAPRRDASDR